MTPLTHKNTYQVVQAAFLILTSVWLIIRNKEGCYREFLMSLLDWILLKNWSTQCKQKNKTVWVLLNTFAVISLLNCVNPIPAFTELSPREFQRDIWNSFVVKRTPQCSLDNNNDNNNNNNNNEEGVPQALRYLMFMQFMIYIVCFLVCIPFFYWFLCLFVFLFE